MICYSGLYASIKLVKNSAVITKWSQTCSLYCTQTKNNTLTAVPCVKVLDQPVFRK